MKRIDNLLNPDETIVKSLKQDTLKLFLASGVFPLSAFMLIGVLVVISLMDMPWFLIFIPIIFILYCIVSVLISRFLTTYYITNKKIIIETGLIGRDYDIVKLDRVLDVNLDVTVVDSILNTGSVKLSTSNEAEPIVIRNVRNPKSVINIIKF